MISSSPVVFVTGGSRGIGKGIVKKFQSEHWNVAACATTEKGAKVSGAELGLVCNVANVDNVKESIHKIIQQFGRLDAVINNAGVAGSNSLKTDENDDLWHSIIDVNLHGTYYVSKYALPHLPNQSGRIINIASVLGMKGVPDQTAYCTSKHAMLGFTKALAHHTAPRQITVNAICPGWVNTDMATKRIQAIGSSVAEIERSVPLNKIIEPDEIAEMAFYLITSKAAINITGQSFTIDAGFMA